jgi:hypothetical protein
MKKIFLLIGIFSIFAFVSDAQNENIKNIKASSVSPVNSSMQQLKRKDITLNLNSKEEEKKFNDYIAAHSNELKKNRTEYTIPVVVHVIYNNSIPAENISDYRVLEQLSRTNSDFRGLSTHSMGPFSSTLKANSDIAFCLASVDPSGNATTGITRTQTTVTSFNISGASASCSSFPERCASTGGCNAWDVTKYLNIWVCNTGGSLTGISEFPSSPLNNFYGATVNYSYFGLTGAQAPYNEGGTLTQQLGHCFNLYNLSGDASCTDMDYCADTLTEYGTQTAIGGGCIADQCNTFCPGIMYMNFMDYSDDTTMANFTPDQVARMLACISLYLATLPNNRPHA